MEWRLKSFDELRNIELYEILKLRNEVFIVEQNCPYQDMDGKDLVSHHLMAVSEGKLLAYTRLIAPGIAYDEASIGRVVTSPAARGTGLGRLLMKESIDRLRSLYGYGPIQIGAQLYLKKFYESFGFVQSSEMYLEDNIEHIRMILR